MCWCLGLIYTRRDWLWWMEDRETPRMHRYGESKTTRITMATVRHVTSCSGLRTFQAAWCLLNRGYQCSDVTFRKTPVTIYEPTRCDILEDTNINKDNCENIRPRNTLEPDGNISMSCRTGWTCESLCVCVCVCVCVCIYLYMYVCIYVRRHVCIYVCMYEWM
jgi:hypothetical protein